MGFQTLIFVLSVTFMFDCLLSSPTHPESVTTYDPAETEALFLSHETHHNESPRPEGEKDFCSDLTNDERKIACANVAKDEKYKSKYTFNAESIEGNCVPLTLHLLTQDSKPITVNAVQCVEDLYAGQGIDELHDVFTYKKLDSDQGAAKKGELLFEFHLPKISHKQ